MPKFSPYIFCTLLLILMACGDGEPLIVNQELKERLNHFQDQTYDSTKVLKGKDFLSESVLFYHGDQLVMQKFYPRSKGRSKIDSILTHFGPEGYRLSFSSWSTEVEFLEENSNIVLTEVYNRDGQLTERFKKRKLPNACGPSPLLWNKGSLVEYRESYKGDSLVMYEDFEKAHKVLVKSSDTIRLHKDFFRAKEKAIEKLKVRFTDTFIQESLVFNISASHYYTYSDAERFSPRWFLHSDSGRELDNYTTSKSNVSRFEFAFDLRIGAHIFKGPKVKVSPNPSFTESKESSTDQRISRLMSPKEALEIAQDYAKWPMYDEATINIDWQGNGGPLKRGQFIYYVNYDFYHREDGIYYARQVKLNALDGSFIEETEIYTSGKASVDVRRKEENGKFGFKKIPFSKVDVPVVYEELPYFCTDFMIAKKDGNYGAINYNNEVVIPFEYNYLEYVKTNFKRYDEWFLILGKSGKYGIYKRGEGQVMDVQYDKFKVTKKEQIIAYSASGDSLIYDMRTGLILPNTN
ncbi:MAG: hypothetical protein AAF487_08270 [Bacteroidota bacterium]